MLCPECQSSEFRSSSFAYDYSSECGISGITIPSAVRMECLKCSNTIVNLGKVSEITREIASQIASVTALRMPAAQLAFLRKNFFKMNLDQFAQITRIGATVLSVTEENDLELNEDLSKIVRELTAIELLTPKELSVTFYDQTITVRPKI